MREIQVITTKKCGTNHKGKISAPKIHFHYNGWDKETVSLNYRDWCEECYVIRERIEGFERKHPGKEVEAIEFEEYD